LELKVVAKNPTSDQTDTGVVTVTAAAELYNPSTGQWMATGSLNTARYGAGTALLQDGENAELYDPLLARRTLSRRQPRWALMILRTGLQARILNLLLASSRISLRTLSRFGILG
jgi:hypothetical protein